MDVRHRLAHLLEDPEAPAVRGQPAVVEGLADELRASEGSAEDLVLVLGGKTKSLISSVVLGITWNDCPVSVDLPIETNERCH